MKAFALTLACLTIYTASNAQLVQSRQIDYPNEGVVLGNGWSSIFGSKTPGACIEFQEVIDKSEDRTSDLKRVVDKEQLNRQMDVSIEFQAKSIGGVGASAKASFTKSLEVKSESLNIVITASVLQGGRFAAPKGKSGTLQLTPQARALAKNDIHQFIARCGDSFVAAVRSGGELNALLIFDIKSRDERETASSTMSAGGLNMSGSATINQTIKKYKENQQLRIVMHSAGGTGIAIPVSDTELMERLKSLPADAATAPKPYRISLARYDQLPDWPAGSLNPKYEDLAQMVAQWQRFESLYLDMYPILQNSDGYVFQGLLTIESIRSLQDRLRLSILPDLQNGIRSCLSGGACEMPGSTPKLDYDVRVLMPVAKESFAEDIYLRKLTREIADLETRYNAAPQTLELQFAGNKIKYPNPVRIRLKKQLEDQRALEVKANAAYTSALGDSMYKQWINGPSFERCKFDATSSYCLSNAQMLEYSKLSQSLVKLP